MPTRSCSSNHFSLLRGGDALLPVRGVSGHSRNTMKYYVQYYALRERKNENNACTCVFIRNGVRANAINFIGRTTDVRYTRTEQFFFFFLMR